MTGWSVATTPSKWDETSRIHELAYTEYLDSLCECGVPREVCQDKTKAWLVDYRVGYRCQAMMKIQRQWHKNHEKLIQSGAVFPETYKWFATEYDMTKEPNDGGESSPG